MEQRLAKRREQEVKDLDLRRRLAEQNIMAGHAKSENVVEKLRRCRSDTAERNDIFTDFQYISAQQEKERKTQISKFEEHLADGLARQKAIEHRQEMDRKRICDASEELRQLKENLHMAKVNKERSQQMLEIQVRKQQDKMCDHRIAEYMEDQRLQHLELEQKLQIEKEKQRYKVKQINQEQIAAKEAQRKEAYEEHLKEKAEVEELVNKIAQEDLQERQAKDQKAEETRKLLRKFMEEQKARADAMEQAERDENERIEQFARDKRAREEAIQKQKEEAEAEKLRLFRQMIDGMQSEKAKKDEMEYLRNELHAEEAEAEIKKKDQLLIRKKLEDREEMKAAYAQQMAAREEKKAAAAKEEDKMRDVLLKKYAEDDRIELMNEQKRRMKVLEHKREADKQIKIKREMFDKMRAEELKERDYFADEEAKRQVIINAERKRLLKEHAAELLDFLPKWTLEKPEDLAHVTGKPGMSASASAPSLKTPY